ncbi:MAG: ABC transporter substrate-binding protein, partial [Candidatus Binatia bacterium]
MASLIGSIVLCLAIFQFVTGKSYGQVDAESVFARVNALPAKERAETLAAEARKEGVVEWYGSIALDDVKELTDRFKKKYPFVEVKYTRSGGTAVLNRFMNESKAGTFKSDVLSARGNFHPTLMKAGLVAKNLAPFRKDLREGFLDRDGYFLGHYSYSFVIGYNTRLVPPDKAPQAYRDLLSPEWAGQIALDLEGYDWLAGIIDIMGEEQGLDLARKLAAQKLRLQRGHSLLTQLVVAGELKVIADGYHFQLQGFKEKGA